MLVVAGTARQMGVRWSSDSRDLHSPGRVSGRFRDCRELGSAPADSSSAGKWAWRWSSERAREAVQGGARRDRPREASTRRPRRSRSSRRCPDAKFDETVEVHFRLGLNVRHADEQLRGTIMLPHGTGRSMRVAVFAEGDKAREAEEAGADVVGLGRPRRQDRGRFPRLRRRDRDARPDGQRRQARPRARAARPDAEPEDRAR